VVDIVVGIARVEDSEIGWVNFVAYIFSRVEGRRVCSSEIAFTKMSGRVTDCMVFQER
jgi:hypothetical protein